MPIKDLHRPAFVEAGIQLRRHCVEAQSVDDYRLSSLSNRDLPMTLGNTPIDELCGVHLVADPCDDAQVLHHLVLILRYDSPPGPSMADSIEN